MALRTSTRLLNARLTTTAVRQQPMRMAMRAQSTLNTGEVLEDPQIGDYPNLPRYSTQTRGPYGWWDPQDKRNFGETVSGPLTTLYTRTEFIYASPSHIGS